MAGSVQHLLVYVLASVRIKSVLVSLMCSPPKSDLAILTVDKGAKSKRDKLSIKLLGTRVLDQDNEGTISTSLVYCLLQ